MSTEGTVTVAPDSTGKIIRTLEITAGGKTVEQQAMVLADATSGNTQAINSNNEASMSTFDLTQAVSITALNGTSVLTASGRRSFAVQLTGTWVGTITFEINIDPTNSSGWVTADVYNGATETWTSSVTANGSWWFEALGAVGAVRVRASAWTSGTTTGLLLGTMSGMVVPEAQGQSGQLAPTNTVLIGGTDGTDIRSLSTDSSGRLLPGYASTGTLGALTTSTSSASLASSNAARKGFIIYNGCASAIYIAFGSTASTTGFTYKILSGATWEMTLIYTGSISWIADVTSLGGVQTTELS
jgi:hypothetical protein